MKFRGDSQTRFAVSSPLCYHLAVFPVIARLGPFTLHTYTFLVDLGIAAGLGWLYRRAPAGRPARWLDAGLAVAVGGFIGARLLYAVVNASYYFGHMGEIFQIWQGGLAWPGALLGGLAGAWLYGARASRKREPLPLASLLDALALPIALLALLSWGGCLASSCAYGREVAAGQLPAWMTMNAPDIYGLAAPRWPTQALGAAWGLIALGLVWGVAERNRRWPAGARGAYALSLIALGAFFLGFTRGDPMPLLNGFRLDVIGSALILVSASAAWAWLVSNPKLQNSTSKI